MGSVRLHIVESKPREIADALPAWLAMWWRWMEAGVTAWGREVGIVGGWILVGVVLVVVSPIALVGQTCRALVRGRR